MTREPMTTLLAGALLVAVALTACLCYWYLHLTAENQRVQVEIARANSHRALMQPLAAECVEYARRNTNFVPVLQSLGIRLRSETNSVSSK